MLAYSTFSRFVWDYYLENGSNVVMVDGGGCGLFLQWGVRCFWVEPFWVEMTQHNYSLELIIRGTAPSSDIQGDFFNWFRP